MRKNYKKYGYSEIVFNDSKTRRLYHKYLHQTIFDKILNFLVIAAIITTITTLIIDYIINLNPIISHTLHGFSNFILLIFVFELLREYAKQSTRKQFFKKHAVDFILIAFLSFYFIFIKLIGIINFSSISKLSELIYKIKNIKISTKLFIKEK
ncbi:MAG: hypothetical protein PF569_04860 [Candidatus Woesearchaeota archaeon]|jgi:hypothetical protein|nr:hypothetical protein [Candidatus Woesearchaeota archaeon]